MRFQSTLPHGERRGGRASPRRGYGFNPRSHTGSDTRAPFMSQADHSFNPRSHTGSDSSSGFSPLAKACFNPRSHTGSDYVRSSADLSTEVSIHAPTRGATAWMLMSSFMMGFQSTLPHGERLVAVYGIGPLAEVSIHAPTRGATELNNLLADLMRFQSTLPHGERRGRGLPRAASGCFNPRSHTGSDLHFFRIVTQRPRVSIHAPTRGATVFGQFVGVAFQVSIHAPTRGATQVRHRPHRG